MATSQFTIYSSEDASGPGPMTGWSGSLITVLDACLVDGYAGKAAAGWTHPIANSASIDGTDVYACYKQPSGSGLTLFINDHSPHGAALGKEAWATGWENMTSLGSPTASVGEGTGQFPIPAQLLTTGHTVMRKSATSDNTNGRQWMIAADAYTMYMWVITGDTANVYYHWGFGDVYSLSDEDDLYKCFIYGRAIVNSAAGHAATLADMTDEICLLFSGVNIITTAMPGHFMARTWGGGGGSITITRKGDLHFATYDGITSSPYGAYMSSLMQAPNGPDKALYVSPLYAIENVGVCLRGRFRGLYQICHPVASFSDGQTLLGGGDYAGKSFRVIKTSVNGGMWALETSNTVETN